MPLLLHGIVPHRPRFLRFDEDIELVDAYGATVIASMVSDERVRLSQRHRQRHAHILEHALGHAGVVLPVRFGTVVRDRSTIIADVITHHIDAIHNLFERLNGLYEMHVRMSWDEAFLLRWARLRVLDKLRLPPEALDNMALLEPLTLSDRRALERSIDEEIQLFHSAHRLMMKFDPSFDALTLKPLPINDITTSLATALLVSREQQAAVERGLKAFQHTKLPETLRAFVTIRVTGPLPPYSFAQWAL